TFLFPSAKTSVSFLPAPPPPSPGGIPATAPASPHPSPPRHPARSPLTTPWPFTWVGKPLPADRPPAGPIPTTGEFVHGREWWLLATDGLYHSTDGGMTLTKVLDEKGAAVPVKGA